MSSYQYRKSHCGDKTILWSSYLHNGISFTDKMASLYWICPLILHEAGAQAFRHHFVNAPSQWETTLHCNVVSHWLGAYKNDPWLCKCSQQQTMITCWTHWPLGDVKVILKVKSPNTYYRLHSWALFVKLLSDVCHRTPLLMGQHWLGAIRHQDIGFFYWCFGK